MPEFDKASLQLRARLWVEHEGDSWLGPGRARLLSAIADQGSISAAARQLGMSYRRAWKLVESINASRLVVARSTGGRGGGGARLTDWGREVLQWYLDSEAEVLALVQRLGVKMNDKLNAPEANQEPKQDSGKKLRRKKNMETA